MFSILLYIRYSSHFERAVIQYIMRMWRLHNLGAEKMDQLENLFILCDFRLEI